MGTQKQHLTDFFFGKICRIGKTIVYICSKKSLSLNYDRHSHFSKKLHFYEDMTTQLFFGQSAPLHLKQKQI